MSTAASAENTMKILENKVNECDNNNINNNCINNFDKNKNLEDESNIFFKSAMNDSDDDMVVIVLQEDNQNNENNNVEEKHETETDEPKKENDKNHDDDDENTGSNDENTGSNDDNTNINVTRNEKIITPKKYIGIEVYTHLQQTLESQKMYPLLPCNMISSFARVMEYVEYFDIPSDERKKLVVDLVKILAYSNNEYGSRDCFEYFVEHNMIDDIIKTIIDSTKNRFDINRFPHTNRKIVLSCVSLSNKIKIVKPSAKIESLFEEFKLNLCGLKRFFKMKEKEESKQT